MSTLHPLLARFADLPPSQQAILAFAFLLAFALLRGAMPARLWSAWAGWSPQGRAVARPRRRGASRGAWRPA